MSYVPLVVFFMNALAIVKKHKLQSYVNII